MSAIKSIESKDTLHNKVFRAVLHPWMLDPIKKHVDLQLGHHLAHPKKAKALGLISESLAYERFPSLIHIALYLFT